MCRSCPCSRVRILQLSYGAYAYYYNFEFRPFAFVAARQLTDFLCSKFDESGIQWWVGQI